MPIVLEDFQKGSGIAPDYSGIYKNDQSISFTDVQIRNMDPVTVVQLYYEIGLFQYDQSDPKRPRLIPHSVISKGLDSFQAELHQTGIRDQIWRVRTDLHEVTDPSTGQRVPVLIDISKVRLIPPTQLTSFGQIMMFISSALTAFIPGVGQLSLLIPQAMNVASKINQMKGMAKQQTDLVSRITGGMETLVKPTTLEYMAAENKPINATTTMGGPVAVVSGMSSLPSASGKPALQQNLDDIRSVLPVFGIIWWMLQSK